MLEDRKLLIAKAGADNDPVYLLPEMANRHGLIAGATGTGKTVTLKTIAESLSAAGTAVFISDIKGDVSGMGISGEATEKLVNRLAGIGVHDYPFQAAPVAFWDVYGQTGIPIRTSISEMGPLLLARLLDLSEVQQGVLNIAFRVADDNGLMLVDLKDLRALLAFMGEDTDRYTVQYGNVSKQSIGAIQRALLQLEDEGGDIFFGEPRLDINDWIRTDDEGRGIVNILDCVRLFQSPLLYSTFMLWMLSELYENLPEVGDLDRPKIVFIFDEAHLLFKDTRSAMISKIEQIIKLIRSKGVGVYFCTQNPADIPDSVLAQLGNRVQHALRAYTTKEQKDIKAAADSFRVNPDFDTADAIMDLATGEALISFLDEDGKPSVVQRAWVIAPMCSMGSMDIYDRQRIVDHDELKERYGHPYDPESAYEILMARAAQDQAALEEAQRAAEEAKLQEQLAREEEKIRAAQEKEAERLAREQERENERLRKEAERAYAQAQKEREKAEREAAKARERIQQEMLKGLTGMARGSSGKSSSRRTSSSRSRQQSDLGTELVRGILGMLKF